MLESATQFLYLGPESRELTGKELRAKTRKLLRAAVALPPGVLLTPDKTWDSPPPNFNWRNAVCLSRPPEAEQPANWNIPPMDEPGQQVRVGATVTEGGLILREEALLFTPADIAKSTGVEEFIVYRVTSLGGSMTRSSRSETNTDQAAWGAQRIVQSIRNSRRLQA